MGKAISGADIDADPFVHVCSHPGCRTWGAFGRRVHRPDGDRAYAWRCRDHLWPDFFGGQTPAPAASLPMPAPLPGAPKPKQGSLF